MPFCEIIRLMLVFRIINNRSVCCIHSMGWPKYTVPTTLYLHSQNGLTWHFCTYEWSPPPANINCNTQICYKNKTSHFQPIANVPCTNQKSAKIFLKIHSVAKWNHLEDSQCQIGLHDLPYGRVLTKKSSACEPAFLEFSIVQHIIKLT